MYKSICFTIIAVFLGRGEVNIFYVDNGGRRPLASRVPGLKVLPRRQINNPTLVLPVAYIAKLIKISRLERTG